MTSGGKADVPTADHGRWSTLDTETNDERMGFSGVQVFFRWRNFFVKLLIIEQNDLFVPQISIIYFYAREKILDFL